MKRKWDIKYFYWGFTAFLVIVCSLLFFWLLSTWSGFVGILKHIFTALSPVIYGLLIAYLLDKVLVFFEDTLFVPCGKKLFPRSEKKAKRSARMFAILFTQLLAWSLVAGLLVLILPQIYLSIENLVLKSSDYVMIVSRWIEELLKNDPQLEETAVNLLGSITTYLTDWVKTSVMPQINEILTNITGGILHFLLGILNFVIGIVISIYFMYHKETFRAQGKKVLYSLFKPKNANKIMNEMTFVHKTFGNFIVGKLIDSIIIGIICCIVLLILKMPYPELISLIIGITNIIPVFGPFIGAIPCAVLVLLESPLQCLIFVIFIIVLQQIDGNIIGPKILGSTIGISGFWILFSILFFGEMFGFIGMLLGVPTFAVIYNAASRFNQRRLAKKRLPVETSEFKKISYIDPSTNEPVYKTSRKSFYASEQEKSGRQSDTVSEPESAEKPQTGDEDESE